MSIQGLIVRFAEFIASPSICSYQLKYFRKMWNASLAFWVLTWKLSKAHFYILNFVKPTGMSTEGKRLRYTEFIVLFSIPKGNVNNKSH